MRIETKEVRDGLHNGKYFWICHYNQPDLNKKPLRNIPPTKALVCSNEDLPKNKRVYYSESHFKEIGKNGKPKSRVISPVDNTGYRSYCGNELYVFESESECRAQFSEQVKEVISRVDFEIKTAQTMWINRKIDLENLLK